MAKPIWDDYVEQRYAEIQKEKQDKADSKEKASQPDTKTSPKDGPWTDFSKMAQQGEAMPNYGGGALPDPNSPVSDSSIQNALAGAGKAFSDVGTGVKQLAVDAVSLLPGKVGADATKRGQELRQETDEERQLSTPLMNTKAGIAGNIGANVLTAVPAALIPGAGTAAGAAAIGGALGAVQPVGTDDSRLQNTAIGAALGGGSQLGLNKLGGALAGRNAANIERANTRVLTPEEVHAVGNTQGWPKGTQAWVGNGQANNAATGINAIAQEGRAAGYIAPPVQTNPTTLNKVINSIVDPKKLEQEFSVKNQANATSRIKEAIGIPADVQLSGDVLDNLARTKVDPAYEALKSYGSTFKTNDKYKAALQNIGEEWNAAAKEFPGLAKNKQIQILQSSLDKDEITPSGAVNIIKKLNWDSKANLKAFDQPDKQALGFAQKKATKILEDLIDDNLSSVGQKDLLTNYRDARQLRAQISNIDGALNDATGDISTKYLAKLLDKGVPLTGELKTAARFAKAFPKSSQDADKLGATAQYGIGDIAAGALGHSALGPIGYAGAALRPLARKTLGSDIVQNGRMGNPSFPTKYTSNALTHGAGKLTNNEVIQRLTPTLLSQYGSKD